MPTKRDTTISAAIIAAAVALVVAYLQFVYKPNHPTELTKPTQYAGRVTNADTKQVIAGARVSVDATGAPPQGYFTDSDGVFYFKLSGSAQAAHLRIEAEGYGVFDRNVALARTGIEEFRLTPANSSVTTPPALTPSPVLSPQSVGAIRITQVPPYNPAGGPASAADIAGEVSGVNPQDVRVVIYTFTNMWYVQPREADPLTSIGREGRWRTEIHTGTKYAALLVNPTFRAQARVSSLPDAVGDVLAIDVEIAKGR